MSGPPTEIRCVIYGNCTSAPVWGMVTSKRLMGLGPSDRTNRTDWALGRSPVAWQGASGRMLGGALGAQVLSNCPDAP